MLAVTEGIQIRGKVIEWTVPGTVPGTPEPERWLYSPKRLLPYRIRLGTGASADSVGRWDFSYCAGAEANVECSNNNGNVMGHAINALGRRQNYAYDALNRISIMDERVSPKASPDCFSQTSVPCRAYSYDNWGNMYVSYERYLERHPFTPAAASNFDAANRLNIQSSTYDLAGNQTAIGSGSHTFTYDAENRLTSSTINSVTTTFEYDGEGRRVKKGNEIYVYDAFGNLAAEYGGTPNPVGTQYLTADHLGSTRVITKQDGTVDRRTDYLPFGESIPTGINGRATAMGYQGTGYLGPLKPGFTGKDRDGETGLDYFGARYLSAAQGRFTSADPIHANILRVLNPQRWNMYAYAVNNPFAYTDPDGRDAIAVNFRAQAYGAGHLGVVSVRRDGSVTFMDYGPRGGPKAVGIGAYRVEQLTAKLKFGQDGVPLTGSLALLAGELAGLLEVDPSTVSLAYFKTSDAETAALDAHIENLRKFSESRRNWMSLYIVGVHDCAGACNAALAKSQIGRGAEAGDVPNWLFDWMYRTRAHVWYSGSSGSVKKNSSRELKPDVSSTFRPCAVGDPDCGGN